MLKTVNNNKLNCREKSPKEPERKSQKKSPATSKKSKPKESPTLKTPKVLAVASEPVVKSESPENKPSNGQAKLPEEESAKDEGKTIKIQSAGAGQAGADYNPSKKKYHPINDAFWKRGEK
jgi:hypothetical protein